MTARSPKLIGPAQERFDAGDLGHEIQGPGPPNPARKKNQRVGPSE